MNKMDQEDSWGNSFGLSLAVGVGTALCFPLFVIPGLMALEDKIRFGKPRTQIVASHDVNNDGRDDAILAGGGILIAQQDGSYVSLEGMRQREIRRATEEINKKYTFREESVRNTWDNLDYQVRTGRLVLEER